MLRIKLGLLAALTALVFVAATAATAEDEVVDLVAHPEEMKAIEMPRLQDAVIVYPLESQEAGERGKVRFTFVVNTDGTVWDVQLDSPSPHWRLNDAAVASALSRSYTPALRDGKPVAVRIWAIVNFNPDPAQPVSDVPLDRATDLQLSCRYGTHHIAVNACSLLLDANKGQAKYLLYPRAHGYEALGRFDLALGDYNKLIGFRPDEAELYRNRGFSHEALGQYDKAVADYDNALKRDARSVVAFFDRGFAHERQGVSGAADFQAGLDARPKCATEQERGVGSSWKRGPWSGDNLFNPAPEDGRSRGLNAPQGGGPGSSLGPDKAKMSLYEHNNTEGAMGTKTVVRIETVCKPSWVPDLAQIPDVKQGAPDELQRAEYRCWARAVSNKWLDAALDDCNRAIALNAGFVRAYATRGLVYFRKGDTAGALRDLDEAVRRNPRLASALYVRGLAKRKMGDVAGAQADILKARSVDPEIASTYARYDVVP